MATRFVRKFSALALMAAVVSIAATALADYTTGTVSGLTARQRRPWNGLVDITFTLAGPESGYCIAIAATNSATGEAIPVCTLRDRAGNAITARTTKFAPGSVSLVWDAMADAPGLFVVALTISVVTAPSQGVQLWEGGPYWAETNIGADEPWEYGLYFWWGDTVGCRREGDVWMASDGSSQDFSFDQANTPTHNKTPATLQMEGWITADGTLAPGHDAAHVQWGGGWRMPTDDELSTLISNCDWILTTMNGVNGYVVQGRGDYSEASIFLPAAGYGHGTSLYSAGSEEGHYWLSGPVYDEYDSLSLHFYSYVYDYCLLNDWGRYYGRTVRPVQVFAE